MQQMDVTADIRSPSAGSTTVAVASFLMPPAPHQALAPAGCSVSASILSPTPGCTALTTPSFLTTQTYLTCPNMYYAVLLLVIKQPAHS